MRSLTIFGCLVSLGLGAKSSCSKSEFYGKTAVADLCDSHFPDKSSENVWMVEFYAPWCGHCKALKPKFIAAAKKLKDSKEFEGIKFGAVDCTQEQALCQKYDVKGYPTLKAFVGGKAKEYQGPRETDEMLEFVTKLRDSKGTKGGSAKCSSSLFDASKKDVVALCSAHFPEKKGKNNWVIVFHTETGKDAKKNLYSLGEKISKGGAKLGVVDCQKEEDFCKAKLDKDEVGKPFVVKTFTKGQKNVSSDSLVGPLSDSGAIIEFIKRQFGSKFHIDTNDEL